MQVSSQTITHFVIFFVSLFSIYTRRIPIICCRYSTFFISWIKYSNDRPRSVAHYATCTRMCAFVVRAAVALHVVCLLLLKLFLRRRFLFMDSCSKLNGARIDLVVDRAMYTAVTLAPIKWTQITIFRVCVYVCAYTWACRRPDRYKRHRLWTRLRRCRRHITVRLARLSAADDDEDDANDEYQKANWTQLLKKSEEEKQKNYADVFFLCFIVVVNVLTYFLPRAYTLYV